MPTGASQKPTNISVSDLYDDAHDVMLFYLVILNIDLPLDPKVYIIGVVPEGLASKQVFYILNILLLTARKMITLAWMRPLIPTIDQWHERLRKVYAMEKITAKLQMKFDVFVKNWAPVICYLNLPV